MNTITILRKEYLALKKKAKELDSIKNENELVSKKLDNIDRKIKSGKRKLLTAEQAFEEKVDKVDLADDLKAIERAEKEHKKGKTVKEKQLAKKLGIKI